jgi:hypothetical protein
MPPWPTCIRTVAALRFSIRSANEKTRRFTSLMLHRERHSIRATRLAGDLIITQSARNGVCLLMRATKDIRGSRGDYPLRRGAEPHTKSTANFDDVLLLNGPRRYLP